ncbi:uncharacterized protein SCODWIG_01045 [Saccharomycodes ludwigii]|uniref:Uncharacterized protein n=1 Tax=Saccharomycodes ludwigii TaxID=36035 RepID=A0A376B470_9ASCO|nr:hypothetical protein SCDLUD_001460 [Saccharomycodes ludwigii]KAH3901689.1 hypothetical protein SCDLUD_001460 [Saccharomycodes ludwigii]SSD59284.1 uncharacterized protein SCODWIG_01045 [Saccharomycodes ludwigii]
MTSLIEGYLKDTGVDYLTDKWNEVAHDKLFKIKDPFYEPNSRKRLKLPPNATKKQQKFWKNCQMKAWRDDKCFLSCCGCFSFGSCGIGMCPLLILIPGIGSALMYYIHMKLITKVQREMPELLTSKQIAKMHSNITFDLLLSLAPVIGSFFTWLNGCSTRNIIIIYQTLCAEICRTDSTIGNTGKNGHTGGTNGTYKGSNNGTSMNYNNNIHNNMNNVNSPDTLLNSNQSIELESLELSPAQQQKIMRVPQRAGTKPQGTPSPLSY